MRKFFWLLGILLILFGFWWFFKNKSLLLTPLSNENRIEKKENSLKMVGFLPTWMVGKTRFYGNELDELIFLGVEVKKNGDLIWDYQSEKMDSEEFLVQKENITRTGGKNILGIKLFDDDDLDELLGNKEAVNNLVGQVKRVIVEKKFDGVNVDFEYQNNPTKILDEKFLDFLGELREMGIGNIGVDVFVNTINKGSVDDLVDLINKIDELIIMAYDFHRPGMDYTGAVAPIEAPIGERSVLELVRNITDDGLDKSKIVLAYPLYGYEWKTYGQEFGARIKRGWYQMSSWDRTKRLIIEKNLEIKWDEVSMTPWLVFEEDGEVHQIYFEDEKSLQIKFDLVKNNKFSGVGFWALGYEGESQVLLVDD